VIFIDTSALIDSLCVPRRSFDRLEMLIASSEQIGLSTLVLYEWLRGPRTSGELLDQERVFPREEAILWGPVDAARAADLYKLVHRPRAREIDIAIAASAMVHNASLWTLDPRDFEDIPGLKLV